MIARLDHVSATLLDRFQRDFPLVPEPFAAVGQAVGTDASGAIVRYREMTAAGLISRIGALVAPNVAGVSTLAAMAVEPAEIERIAAIVSAEPGVNHNYEREHAINLWFVVSEPDETELHSTLKRIEDSAGITVRDLRLEEPYHLDLGFPLSGKDGPRNRLAAPDASILSPLDVALLAAIAGGLPLIERPYRQIGMLLGQPEVSVLARLEALLDANVIRRFGVVVRHRQLGIDANAMAVWNTADGDTAELGLRLAQEPGVTLCYRRRRATDWPYNLYCMVHGKDRAETYSVVARLNSIAAENAKAHAVLFSVRCFKQSGRQFQDPRVAA